MNFHSFTFAGSSLKNNLTFSPRKGGTKPMYFFYLGMQRTARPVSLM